MTVFVKTGDPETSGHLVSFGGEVFGDEAINPTLNTSPYHKGRQEERHHGNKSSKYNSCQTWLFRISMLNFAGCKQNFIGNGYFYIFFIGFPSGSFLSQAQNGSKWCFLDVAFDKRRHRWLRERATPSASIGGPWVSCSMSSLVIDLNLRGVGRFSSSPEK